MEKWETGGCLVYGAMLGKPAREHTEVLIRHFLSKLKISVLLLKLIYYSNIEYRIPPIYRVT